jgi:hypothetical protein
MPSLLHWDLFSPGSEICPDQPNRRIRTRTYGGVGGALSDERPYPDGRHSEYAGQSVREHASGRRFDTRDVA